MIPKKSLGQNFLTNQDIVASIVDAGKLSPKETVLEIGPGKGVLTEELLKRGVHVIAVEKDRDLIPFLEEKFEKEITKNQLDLKYGDILDQDFSLREREYSLIANIPYYITGQIIRKFLETTNQPKKMVILVQKEVAERIIAKDKKESLLSVSVKAYGNPEYIKTVKAGAFTPMPKVDSAVLLIDNISRDFFRGISEEDFFNIIHAGFAHKRKQLFGNLKTIIPEEILREKMKKCGIRENERAENLSPEQWKALLVA